MLVDGPGSWADSSLQAMGGDDVVINNEGTDGVYGGDGNDLLISAAVCNGDTIDGGLGVNNASWAQLDGSKVVADLATSTAGNQSGPTCSGGLATLTNILDLEGSDQYDGLFGGGGINQLLGRLGQDSLYGRNGDDDLLAEDGIHDTVDCGGGTGDQAAVDGLDTFSGCEFPR
jgi:Ca2+-binding RTX toxin-like protein